MDQDDLLSTLRQLEPVPEPSMLEEISEKLSLINNHLDDLKLKQSITNENLMELVEQLKARSGSDHAAQARRNRNTPRPIKRRSWNEIVSD